MIFMDILVISRYISHEFKNKKSLRSENLLIIHIANLFIIKKKIVFIIRIDMEILY